ncbi:DUF192 domain-containing protein [Erythrobacter sp. HA6-11]
MVKAFSLLFAFLLAACSAADTGSASAQTTAQSTTNNAAKTHPVSGLEIIEVTVQSGENTYIFDTELAATSDDQAQGLMFRTELGEFEAMLFPSNGAQMRSFWMKNTPLPLDIIFIGPDNRIINIGAMAEPYSLDSVPSAAPAIAVFEIIGGRAEELGIKPGDLVTWEGS